MSESENGEQRSEVCNGGNGDDEEDKEDDEEGKEEDDNGADKGAGGEGKEEVGEWRGREVNGKGVFGVSRDFRNAVKRRRKQKEKERVDGEIISLPSSSFSLAAAARRGRRSDDAGGFYQPRMEESPDTPMSDPNSESFSCEMLRTLIERNDFYCKECNPHI